MSFQAQPEPDRRIALRRAIELEPPADVLQQLRANLGEAERALATSEAGR